MKASNRTAVLSQICLRLPVPTPFFSSFHQSRRPTSLFVLRCDCRSFLRPIFSSATPPLFNCLFFSLPFLSIASFNCCCCRRRRCCVFVVFLLSPWRHCRLRLHSLQLRRPLILRLLNPQMLDRPAKQCPSPQPHLSHQDNYTQLSLLPHQIALLFNKVRLPL